MPIPYGRYYKMAIVLDSSSRTEPQVSQWLQRNEDKAPTYYERGFGPREGR